MDISCSRVRRCFLTPLRECRMLVRVSPPASCWGLRDRRSWNRELLRGSFRLIVDASCGRWFAIVERSYSNIRSDECAMERRKWQICSCLTLPPVVCHVFVVVFVFVFVFVNLFEFILASSRTVRFCRICHAGFSVKDGSACATDRRSGLVRPPRAVPVSRFTTSAAMLTGTR